MTEFQIAKAPPYVPGHQLLAGKSVLITAAAGAGIGFAAARRCAEEGCRALFISDIHEKRLEQAVQTLRAETGLQQIYGRLCNVSVEADVQALVADAQDKLDGVDVLINNAGLGGSTRIVDMDDAEWSRVIDISLTGTFRMTRAMLPHMQARGRGAIVNNASVLGWRAHAARRSKRRRTVCASTRSHRASRCTIF